jgi:hypothetical protein
MHRRNPGDDYIGRLWRRVRQGEPAAVLELANALQRIGGVPNDAPVWLPKDQHGRPTLWVAQASGGPYPNEYTIAVCATEDGAYASIAEWIRYNLSLGYDYYSDRQAEMRALVGAVGANDFRAAAALHNACADERQENLDDATWYHVEQEPLYP